MEENEKTKIKIRCNPYRHKIEYQRWDIEQERWRECSEESSLRQKEFCESTIQHNAYDILSAIEESAYNRESNGVEIVFEGTDEDYHDIYLLVKSYFANKGLTCSRGEESLISTEEAKEKIEDIYNELIRQTFEEEQIAPDQELRTILNKFFEANNQEIPICVVGTYSAGKSAFVNALLGAELLPSTDDPTTARIYRIEQASDSSRSMIYLGDNNDEKYIRFDKDTYEISSQVPMNLCKLLQEALEAHKEEPSTDRIFYALSIINDYAIEDETWSHIGSLIRVQIPFEKGLLADSNRRFVVYDTPGSNSESHEEHFKVLKEHLAQCTNGLPIIVTKNDMKDSGDTQVLLNELKKIRGNLDMTNAMVIVNQADQIVALESNRDKSQGILEKWKSNRLYYAASIIGLGSQIKNPEIQGSWCDKCYEAKFCMNYEYFLPGKQYYKQPYRYNKIATDQLEAYIASVEDIQEPSQLLYVNSGIDCIVKHIQEFADKYAAYNKCSQASQYLEEAINYIQTKIAEKQTERETQLEKLRSKLNNKRQKLVNQLDNKKKEMIDEVENNFPNEMRKIQKKARDSMNKQLDDRVEEFVKKFEKAKEFTNKFASVAETLTKEYISSCKSECRKMAEDFLDKVNSSYGQIIDYCEDLSDEEKEKIKQSMSFPDIGNDVAIDVNYKDIRKRFLWIPLAKVNKKSAKETYERYMREVIAHPSHDLILGTQCKAEEHAADMLGSLVTELANRNPELKSLSNDCKNSQNILAELNKKQAALQKNDEEIISLTDFVAMEDL